METQNVIIGVIYRPNTAPRADLDLYSSTLYDIMGIINNGKQSCTIMGDMNIDLLKCTVHSKTNEYIDNIFSRGFLPIITKPTRVCSTAATLIDHIYTNNLGQTMIPAIVLTDVSDHFGTRLFSLKKIKQKQKTLNKYRIFSEHNINKFKTTLQNTDFEQIMSFTSANMAYDKFLNLYKDAFNNAFPIKTGTSNKKVNIQPWANKDFISSSLQKNKFFKEQVISPSESNLERYSTHNKSHNRLKRSLKSSYFSNLIEENKYDMKKT